MVECMLLGFKEGVSKKNGNKYWQVFLIQECTPVDNQYGRVGLKEVDFFVDESVFKKITSQMIGQMVEITVSGFGKFAQIKDIKLAK